MHNLYHTFPGGYKKAVTGYEYFLVGDIFLSKKLHFDFALYKKMEETSLALGNFSAKIEKIPDLNLFIIAYSNKEANQSSMIEGTQTQVEDAFIQEEDVTPEKRDDWQELNCYIKALNNAIKNLDNLPLCNRLLKTTHKILLSQVRGKDKLLGEFRHSQNWIGGSRPDNTHFVPPVHEYLNEAMGNLEKFIQDKTLQIPHLIKVALIHYQFETIHPFLDGNGRIGRMLISLYLLENKILRHPILYISNFFEKNRRDYYATLDRARENTKGICAWISFFLDAVLTTANEGIIITEQIIQLRKKILEEQIPTLGRRSKNAIRLLDLLFQQPIINAKKAAVALKLTPQATQNLLTEFINLTILKEITGYRRNRIFSFDPYIKILSN